MDFILKFIISTKIIYIFTKYLIVIIYDFKLSGFPLRCSVAGSGKTRPTHGLAAFPRSPYVYKSGPPPPLLHALSNPPLPSSPFPFTLARRSRCSASLPLAVRHPGPVLPCLTIRSPARLATLHGSPHAPLAAYTAPAPERPVQLTLPVFSHQAS